MCKSVKQFNAPKYSNLRSRLPANKACHGDRRPVDIGGILGFPVKLGIFRAVSSGTVKSVSIKSELHDECSAIRKCKELGLAVGVCHASEEVVSSARAAFVVPSAP